MWSSRKVNYSCRLPRESNRYRYRYLISGREWSVFEIPLFSAAGESRAANAVIASVRHMGANHRRVNMVVREWFLHRADVIAVAVLTPERRHIGAGTCHDGSPFPQWQVYG